MITIRIKTDNAAFENDNYCGQTETARILRELASEIASGTIVETLYDLNGNAVGCVTGLDTHV